MEAIILAGGYGKRLRDVVKNRPKPMALIADKPFLCYLLQDLAKQGVTRVILSTGYKHEVIEDYFERQYLHMAIDYSREETPLLTGGALKKACQLTTQHHVLVLNGDTYFQVDIQEMYEQHLHARCDITVALKEMVHFERYGVVETDGQRIIQFKEKEPVTKGKISGGIYVLRTDLFDDLPTAVSFSFEQDILEKHIQDLHIQAYLSAGYFIDIGVPADYYRAQEELPLKI